MCLNEKDFITSGNKIKQKISGEKHLDKSPQTKDVDRVRTIKRRYNNFSLQLNLKNKKISKNRKNFKVENIPIKQFSLQPVIQ